MINGLHEMLILWEAKNRVPTQYWKSIEFKNWFSRPWKSIKFGQNAHYSL